MRSYQSHNILIQVTRTDKSGIHGKHTEYINFLMRKSGLVNRRNAKILSTFSELHKMVAGFRQYKLLMELSNRSGTYTYTHVFPKNQYKH